MAVTATKYPGTVASETIPGGNSQDWINPGNVSADDTSEATWDVSTASSDIGPYLKTTNYAFTSSDVPSGSTVDGKTKETRRREGGVSDNITTLRHREVKGGTIGGTDVSNMNTAEWRDSGLESGAETITEGGSTNLWNNTWTAEDVWASDTGEAMAPNGAGTTPSCAVDFMRVWWNFTAPTFSPKVMFM